jgi:hypothetical protein
MARPISRRTLFAGAFAYYQHNLEVVLLAGIEFKRLSNQPSRRRYLRIHGNEETAGQALTEHMRTRAGIAYLVTNKERNVAIAGGRIDPNRLFSREGADASLRRLNPDWTPIEITKALDWLDSERPNLLAAILPPGGELLFAVHNNSQGYSVEDEIPISQRTSLPRRAEPHEFFLATDPRDYQRLAAGPYNVVLQNDPAGPDDGSLSRLCAKRGIRYVNLEVASGKLAMQREMMEWLENTLPE